MQYRSHARAAGAARLHASLPDKGANDWLWLPLHARSRIRSHCSIKFVKFETLSSRYLIPTCNMTNALSPIKRARGFETEAELVDVFVRRLQAGRTPFGSVQVMREWDHKSGSVDVLVRDRDQELVAIEAKLADWKRAFRQAYRSTAYANRVFVLLPTQVVHRALRDEEEFRYRGIGLCSFDGRCVKVIIEAIVQEPLLHWLRSRAHEHFNKVHGELSPRRHRVDRTRDLSTARI